MTTVTVVRQEEGYEPDVYDSEYERVLWEIHNGGFKKYSENPRSSAIKWASYGRAGSDDSYVLIWPKETSQ